MTDPHNDSGKNTVNTPVPAGQTPKKVSALTRLGMLVKQKDKMYPLRDLENSEKVSTTPVKISGLVILKRAKKRRMNIQRRYHGRLRNGLLKLYKQKDKQKDGKPFTAEFNIDLSTLSQILYNDDVKKFSLVFQKEVYTLKPETSKYLEWKTGLQQHRLFRQYQRKENLLDDSEKSQVQKTELAFQTLNVEEMMPAQPVKLDNKGNAIQDNGQAAGPANPLLTQGESKESPKKDGEKDEKKSKDGGLLENNNPVVAGTPKKKSKEEAVEELKLSTALKALTTALETCKTVNNSSIQILERVQKCYDDSNDILRELRKLRRKKRSKKSDDGECSSEDDDEDSISIKEATKEPPAAIPAPDPNTMALPKPSASTINIHEDDQNANIKRTPSLPNIALSTARNNQSETRIRQQDPQIAFPTQPPAPSTAPSQAQVKPKVETPRSQLHPSLQPPKKRREHLPHEQIYGDSIPMMAILRKSLPIHAYEPLGILQSACEELRFAGNFLDRLQKVNNPGDRMSLISGFIISGYSSMSIRNRKPFNPLLGETFDYISDDGWKYHAEQVSHHPPVSACNADGPGWEWQQTLHGTITPSLDGSTSLNCLLPIRLTLANGEEYCWNKVTTIIQNARSEAQKRKVKNEGEMVIKCSNGYECRMVFLSERNIIRGEIKSNTQEVVFRLIGHWDKGLNRVLASNEQERLFEAPPPYQYANRYYGFNKFTLSLNEITPEQRPYIPITDSRLRPDQRFLEQGDSKRSHDAKASLEQAQRQRSHLPHRQMWFVEKMDPFSQKNLWISNKKYWASKQCCFKDQIGSKMLALFSGE